MQFLLCYSDPKSHPFISDKEKDYLQREMGQMQMTKHKTTLPWKSFLTSVPVWSLVMAQVSKRFFKLLYTQNSFITFICYIVIVKVYVNVCYNKLRILHSLISLRAEFYIEC